MNLIKIGLANPDPTVGAFRSNTERLVQLAGQMSKEGCTIVCFPEQSISGYPVEDLLLWRKFIEGQWEGLVAREKLPTYGVCYEKRTYSAGIPGFVSSVNDVPFGDLIFQFPFGKMAIEVCKDIWSPAGPMRRRSYSGAETIINISASPYRAGVLGTRRELISTRA